MSTTIKRGFHGMKQKQKQNQKMKKNKKPKNASSRMYVNVNRQKKGYRDKYKVETDKALKKFKMDMGKPEDYELTEQEWKQFFRTILIPMDKERETKMIDMFKDNRQELNNLLILHNTKAGENLAEVYFKRYQKDCPTKWYDLDDFKQLASEGLAIAAKKFDLNYKNRFLTYATWWILNKVRKPYQDKGAMLTHASLNAPIKVGEDENKATMEDLLTSDDISPDWRISNGGEGAVGNPFDAIDRKNIDENHDLCVAIRQMGKGGSINNLDVDRANEMMDYLSSIIENNSSQKAREIFLYIFKKVFSKYSTICGSSIPVESMKRLESYVMAAAKSKAELLNRLNMNEKQYEMACRRLTMGEYDGV